MLGNGHERDVLAIAVAARAAEDDDALLDEGVREGRVLLPALLAPAPGVVPTRAARELDEVVVGQAMGYPGSG